MHHLPIRRRCLLALLVLALGGCASLPLSMQPPEVSVADLRLIEAGLLEQRFGLSLRVLNPNDVDIPVEGLRFAVELNGKPFARGVSGAAVTIPRLGEAVLEVEAVSSLAGMLRQLRAFGAERQRIDYRIAGELVTGGLRAAMPFERSGEIDLSDLGGSTRF
ncbi:MAG: LEA type 2 family protein [Rhodocyclaceae bacterium]|nr:LEA type 2 family protein [Rhodocyclaceae bacterium]